VEHSIKSLLFGFILLAGGASLGSTDDPVTFESGRFRIPTLEQFHQRISELHPDLTITSTTLNSFEYRNENFRAIQIEAMGIQGGQKVEQTTIHVETHPGLYRMVSVDTQICIQGYALNSDGVSEIGWRCQVDPFPIRGFGDIYMVESSDVDLNLIQEAFSEPIIIYQPETEQDESLMSLGDMLVVLDGHGVEYEITETQYTPHYPEGSPTVSALMISAKGQVSESLRVEQTFTYAIAGEQLVLKEMDGIICRRTDLIESGEACDGLYQQSPVTPFPFILLNSHEVSQDKSNVAVENETPVIPQNSCGPVYDHLSSVLRYHFERSTFSINDVEEYERFLLELPQVIDPFELLLSAEDKQDWVQNNLLTDLYSENVSNLVEEIRNQQFGDCSWLTSLVDNLRQSFLQKNQEAQELFNRIEASDFNLSALQSESNALSETQQRLLMMLPQGLDRRMRNHDPSIALDVKLAEIQRYISNNVEILANLETASLAAMLNIDSYSGLLLDQRDRLEMHNIVEGTSEKQFFGLSVLQGLSGKFYISRTHPLAEAQGVAYGDQILSARGRSWQSLTYEQMDELLLDVDQSLHLEILRGGETLNLVLNSSRINPLDNIYSVEYEEKNGLSMARITIHLFEQGLADKIKDDLLEILESRSVDFFYLDLRGNPGGNISEGLKVMSLFVRDQVLLFSRLGARNAARVRAYESDPEFFIDDEKPLIVHVNGQTASTSEKVAGGLQSLGRSYTVGQQTYGKLVGIYRHNTMLSDGRQATLLITGSEYFMPDGRALNGIGVLPDRVIETDVPRVPFHDGLRPGQDLDSDLTQGLDRQNIAFPVELTQLRFE
jgi:C-terminal peptidase prc